MGFLALVACEAFRCHTSKLPRGHQTCAPQLCEPRKPQCHRNADGRGRLATGMAKRQKEIFACLGMEGADVVEQVAKLKLWPGRPSSWGRTAPREQLRAHSHLEFRI